MLLGNAPSAKREKRRKREKRKQQTTVSKELPQHRPRRHRPRRHREVPLGRQEGSRSRGPLQGLHRSAFEKGRARRQVKSAFTSFTSLQHPHWSVVLVDLFIALGEQQSARCLRKTWECRTWLSRHVQTLRQHPNASIPDVRVVHYRGSPLGATRARKAGFRLGDGAMRVLLTALPQGRHEYPLTGEA